MHKAVVQWWSLNVTEVITLRHHTNTINNVCIANRVMVIFTCGFETTHFTSSYTVMHGDTKLAINQTIQLFIYCPFGDCLT